MVGATGIEPVTPTGVQCTVCPIGLSLSSAWRMRSRRLAAERWLRTARPRRILGIALVLVGMVLWGIAVLPSPLRGPLGVISGGALVAVGIILIATSY
jgi:polyferredoxin